MAKNEKRTFETAQRNKAQRDETRKRGGWKDERRQARKQKGKRAEFFAKGAE